MLSLVSQRDVLNIRPGRLFIGGQWLDWPDARFDQLNPCTNEVMTSFAEAGPRGVALAATAARKAFDEGPWPRMRAQDRKRLLQPIVEQLYAVEDEIARLQALDNGIPYTFSRNSRVSPKAAADIFDHSQAAPRQSRLGQGAFRQHRRAARSAAQLPDDDSDQRAMVAVVRMARAVLQARPFAPHYVDEMFPGKEVRTDGEILAFARQRGGTVDHHNGTTRMGPDSDPMAVVDARLRVRGVHGLRVADASVMPLPISGATNAATIMIGEKAADMLLRDAKTTS